MFDHLDKINIIFPIPGETEVIVHDFNYKRVEWDINSLYKMRVKFADLPASYTKPAKGKELEMSAETVQKDVVVSMEYTLQVDNEEIDSSKGQDPLQFLAGHGNIISGLEREMMGMKVGDSKDVVIQPADAYGEFDDQAYMDVPRKDFPTDMEIEEGSELTVRDDSGQSRYARIEAIDGDTVRLNFNHPLAGDELYFNVKVVGLREPTSEELEHEHVHQDGHHH
jgi:FKBP-type peptidyl-prolyl cis-trans isomerase SlyD